MPAVNLSPLFCDAQLDSSGNPLSGGKLFTYSAGSSTKLTTYQDSAGTTPHANPIVLNSRGEPSAPIWLTDGSTYKFVLTTSGDSDPPASPIRTTDNITGVNDIAATAQSQWIAAGLSPTYVSATSFTLAGDQTTEFHVGRRLKLTDSGGTDYATIAASAFGALTTVTLVLDSGSLDSGLSAVSYGIASAANTSLPINDTEILAWNGPLAPHENLAVIRPSAATLTITADKLVATNTAGRKAVLSAVSVTPSLASSGANGLDTGAEAASTWYHAWVIWNGATVAGLLSLSATAPTMPSGYTHKAYVGADYNDSGSNLIDIYQRSGLVHRIALQLLTGGSATSLTSVAVTAAVPPNAKALRFIAFIYENVAATIDHIGYLAPNNAAAFEYNAIYARSAAADQKGNAAPGYLLFRSASQALYYRVSTAEADMDLTAVGWEF